MKAKLLAIFVVASVLVMTAISCNKKDDEMKAEDAKVEIRNSIQEINNEAFALLAEPSVQSLAFLSQLMDIDLGKSAINKIKEQPGKIHLAKIKQALMPRNSFKSSNDFDDLNLGIYVFNFEIDDFTLVEESESIFKVTYPADETAYEDQENNAELLVENIELVVVEYTETYYDDWNNEWITETYEEEVPVKFNATQKIDGATTISGSYNADLNPNGFPTGASVSFDAAPYNITGSLSGSGQSFNTKHTSKKGATTIMGHDININYTSDMEDVEKLSGNYFLSPLKVEGSVKVKALNDLMDKYDETDKYNLKDLNAQIDLKLIQMSKGLKIGDIEFVTVSHPFGGEMPTLAIVYSDGSYDLLDEFFDFDLKSRKKR
ncbi:MAG: hypothetical protein WBJ84_07105 [Bacteroidales bacterium]